MSLITQFSITSLLLIKELICIQCYFVTHNFIDPVFCLFACVVGKKKVKRLFRIYIQLYDNLSLA